jgi:hypothetical protein
MKQDQNRIDFKSWIFTSKPKSIGRPICAMIGIVAAATLYRMGYLSAEPTMASGVAFAALGAIAGVVVYGLYDAVRKMR